MPTNKRSKQYVVHGLDTTYYYKDPEHTILHRTDGPAIVNSRTNKWYINGKLHRDNEPAIEWAEGGQDWYQHGKRHRTGGPAISFAGGVDGSWLINDKLHRLDGPAVNFETKQQWYYINDISYSKQTFPKGVQKWVSYIEVTTEDIKQAIGNYRIVEW